MSASDPGAHPAVPKERYVGDRDLTHWGTGPGRRSADVFHRASRRIGAQPVLVLTLLVGGAVALLLTAVFALVYDSITDRDGVAGLDRPLLMLAKRLRTPFLDVAVTAYTNIGGVYAMPVIAVGVMVLLALRRHSWTPVILILAAGGGSLLMTIAGKPFFHRARPRHIDAVPPYETSASFPSGHSLNAIVIAGIVAYLLILRQDRTWQRVLTIAVAAVFAFTIGLSRVFLGHHWFTDVLGAWVLGIAWLAIVITAHRLYLTARHRGAPAAPPTASGSGATRAGLSG